MTGLYVGPDTDETCVSVSAGKFWVIRVTTYHEGPYIKDLVRLLNIIQFVC